MTHVWLWIVFAALALGAGVAQAQDLREAGRKLSGQYQDAVVTVKIVLSIQGDDGANEFQSETCGTVISPEGLVVVPLFALDPMAMAKRMAGPAIGMMMPATGNEVKSVKLQRGRTAEIPATVVLRDNDLNIAFLRPIDKPQKAMAFVDLAQSAQCQPLDPIITMTRLGNVADRQIGLLPGTIQAVVTRPRKYYVPTGGFAGFGVPVFDANGKLLGISAVQTSLGGIEELQNGIMSLNLSHMGILPIILPAADLKEIAAQAPEKAAPTPTPKTVPAAKQDAKTSTSQTKTSTSTTKTSTSQTNQQAHE